MAEYLKNHYEHEDNSGESTDIRKRLVEMRWAEILAQQESVREKLEEDDNQPMRYLEDEIGAWENRHRNGESVDVNDPLDRVIFMLALIIEKGAEWSDDRKKAIRRVAFSFLVQSLPRMSSPEQRFFQSNLLLHKKTIEEEISQISSQEKDLVSAQLDKVQ